MEGTRRDEHFHSFFPRRKHRAHKCPNVSTPSTDISCGSARKEDLVDLDSHPTSWCFYVRLVRNTALSIAVLVSWTTASCSRGSGSRSQLSRKRCQHGDSADPASVAALYKSILKLPMPVYTNAGLVVDIQLISKWLKLNTRLPETWEPMRDFFDGALCKRFSYFASHGQSIAQRREPFCPAGADMLLSLEATEGLIHYSSTSMEVRPQLLEFYVPDWQNALPEGSE